MKKVQCRSVEAIIHPNGIIEAAFRPSWKEADTPETTREIALMLQEAVGGEHRGLLYFPPNLFIRIEAVKAFLDVPIGHAAEAFVVTSFGPRLLCNLMLKFRKHSVPAKVFDNRAEAEEWLLEQLANAKEIPA
jgi:hypothetical protein